jgi:alpha-L-fucosidase
MRRKHFLLLVVCLLVFSVMSLTSERNYTSANGNVTDWFSDAGYGVMVHWTSLTMPETGSKKAFFDAVNDFDVDLFAEQLEEAGAGYVIFTISHRQMYLPFPNATLDSVLPGRTSQDRDLILDLYNALEPLGIKIILYHANIGSSAHDNPWYTASKFDVDNQYFAQLQYDITTEIGLRYGNKVAGWWIDNCHESNGYDNKFGDFSAYSAALKAGNPDRIIAYNFSGSGTWNTSKPAGIQEYAAGEQMSLSRLPASRFSGEASSQWHTAANMDYGSIPWYYNGNNNISPNYSNETVANFIRKVMLKGGVFSYNSANYQEGHMDDSTMNQLRFLKRAIRVVEEDGFKKIDNYYPGIVYTGSWSHITQASNYNNSVAYSAAANDSMAFTFNGTAVTLYTKKGGEGGIFDIFLDGVLVSTYDSYSASGVFQSIAYQNSSLASGIHTISVVVKGTKNPNSNGKKVHIDYIKFLGNPTPPPTITQVDDPSGLIGYNGSWTHIARAQSYNDTISYSKATNAYAEYTFNGTSIKMYTQRGPGAGIFNIYLDGVLVATYDSYFASGLHQQLAYNQQGLSSGSHTIKIVVTGTKNSNASNNYVHVDYFQVTD